MDVRTIRACQFFVEHELDEISTIYKFWIVRQEDKRQVGHDIEHCNLDRILSVGYRVKSQQGVAFCR